MKNEIKEFISQRPVTSFHELRQIEGFSGDFELSNPEVNILYWHDLSEEAMLAIIELLTEEVIELVQCSPLIYINEGDYKGKLPQLGSFGFK